MPVSTVRPKLVDIDELHEQVIQSRDEGIDDAQLLQHLTDIFTVDLDLLEDVRQTIGLQLVDLNK